MDNKQNNEHSVLCSYGYTVHAYIGLACSGYPQLH